ncbi:MAG: flagellar biosynthesis anti-sigma factor FlgM [Thermodesulforhabdaceae bacterium]
MDVKKVQQAQFYYGNVSNVKPSSAQQSAQEVMRIDRIQNGQTQQKATNKQPATDKVEFSAQALAAYEQSRTQQIENLQKSIQQGSYKINPTDIANKMLEESW